MRSWIHDFLAWLAMTVGHLVVLSLGRTWRVKHVGGDHVRSANAESPSVLYAFTHGVLFPLAFTHRGRQVLLLISASRDGEIIARITRRLGFGAVRGSSSKGGGRAIVGMAAAARKGIDLAITPDGPRGPRGSADPGVAWIAARAKIPIVPVGVSADRAWRARSWDRFLVPKPRARVWVAYGAPMECQWTGEEIRDAQTLESIREALARVEERAIACAEGREVPERTEEMAPVSVLRSAYRGIGRAGVALGLPGAILRGRPEERRERLGWAPEGEGRHPLWVHAASVGETVAAEALLRALRDEPDAPPIALSTMTRTARERAAGLAPDLGPFHPPLDVPGPVERALDRLAPRALVVLETELWPVLVEETVRRGIPWGVASGRVSARSFGRMRRLRSFVHPLVSTVSAVAARTPLDAERFAGLGVPAEAIAVTGDLKEDREVAPWEAPPSGRVRWIAACTRPGEEEEALDVVEKLSARRPSGELILAPRHPERFREVAALLESRGIHYRRWDARDEPPPDGTWSVLLVDAMGVLDEAYSRAAVAFVGGSLRPYRGHSPLEAAAAGRPILMGPHTENCRDAVERLAAAGVHHTVASAAELARALERTFGDPERAEAAGRAARDVVAASSGAAARTIAHLRSRGVL